MNRLAIVVLNWNGAEDALKCIKSLQQQTLQPTIVIVDNNSSDNSVDQFENYIKTQKKYTPVLIKNSRNLGFAGGINTGLTYARKHNFEFVGMLNPDDVADKDLCESLVAELEKHNTWGIATGLLLRCDGKTIDSSGDFYTTWGLPGPRNRDEPISNAPTRAGEVFGATGGGSISRMVIFNDIAMFDEAFFMYYEDVDISFRAQLAGWRIRYTPAAIAYHKVGASSRRVPGLAVFNTFKNLPLLFIKNVPGHLFLSIGMRFFLTYWLIFFSAIRHGNGLPALRGMLASLSKQPAAYKKRRSIQQRRRVTVSYIKDIIHKGPLPNQTGLLNFRRFFKRSTDSSAQ